MDNIVISTTLENVCLKQNKSIISGPFGSNISSKFFVERGIPVIRGNNLTVGKEKFLDYGFVYVTDEKAKELNCYALKDDLIFTSAGTLGQVGIIPENARFKEYVISNKQIRVRIDNDIILPIYAYYWFSSPWIQKKLCDNNKGSTVPLLTLSEIKSLPIKYPKDINEQKKIVNILNSIDEQLKRNSEMVQKLQVLSQTIFNKFFNNKIYEFNGILHDLCTLPSGFSFEPSYYVTGGKYKLITIKNVNGIFVDTDRVDTLNEIPSRMKDYCNLTKGDILISLTGNVGRISINSSSNCLLNQRVSKIVCSNDKYKFYLYLLLSTNYYQGKMQQMASGTSQKNLSPLDVENLRIFIPDNIDEFNNATKNILCQLCEINTFSVRLQDLKNKILPLLINRQIE